jgi:hypothetical protein
MGQAFSNGMGISQMIAGFMDGANNTPDVITAVNKATEIAGKVGTAIAERIKPTTEP